MVTILEAINEPMRMRRKGLLTSNSFGTNSHGDALLAWATYILREFYKKNPNAAALQTSVAMSSVANQTSYALSTIASNLIGENIKWINNNVDNYIVARKQANVFYKYWNPLDNPDATDVMTGKPVIYYVYGNSLYFHPIIDETTTSLLQIFYTIPFTTALVKENFSNSLSTLLATDLIIPEHNRNVFTSAMMYAIDEIFPDDTRSKQLSFSEWIRQQKIIDLDNRNPEPRIEISNDIQTLLGGMG
jgi:hypothetical protein